MCSLFKHFDHCYSRGSFSAFSPVLCIHPHPQTFNKLFFMHGLKISVLYKWGHLPLHFESTHIKMLSVCRSHSVTSFLISNLSVSVTIFSPYTLQKVKRIILVLPLFSIFGFCLSRGEGFGVLLWQWLDYVRSGLPNMWAEPQGNLKTKILFLWNHPFVANQPVWSAYKHVRNLADHIFST